MNEEQRAREDRERQWKKDHDAKQAEHETWLRCLSPVEKQALEIAQAIKAEFVVRGSQWDECEASNRELMGVIAEKLEEQQSEETFQD